ncbi:aminotransferase class III-fold pyridoxal phosphate-dependent enzyme [Herbidospora daliensis]|uniref:aminotransferase class III-fold pyridoxal phosphate-dependent enzyme n=1 Tax=Herbidospora daliensis TaxID=295585 RepID=UPI00078258B5|nr:aminotransferase class III-fold pyridoxal phosphate-dependent enzyme [Herbidospora daliensis]
MNVVRPDVTLDQAREIADTCFGVRGEVREVGSNQDRNYVVDGRYLLKVANTGYTDAELDAQDAALLHLRDRMRVPQPQPAAEGGYVARFGDGLRARLLTFVPGRPLIEHAYLAPVVVGRLGDLAGRLAANLADLDHPGLDRVSQWDLRRARTEIDQMIGSLSTGRDLVRRAADLACDRLDALAGDLRTQAVHGDLTDDNVVCSIGRDGRPVPDGVIDFGDLGHGWIVGELAVTCASLLHHAPERPLAILPAVRAFQRVVPLSGDELAALWPAIVARTAVLVVSGVHQALLEPDNDYATERQDAEFRAFETALSLPFEVAEAAFRESPPARFSGAPIVPVLPVRDLSVTGELPGGVLETYTPEEGVAHRAGEPRLTETRIHSFDAPATVPLGVESRLPAGTAVHAPFDGEVHLGVLHGATLDLRLSGVEMWEGPVRAGDQIGAVSGPVYATLCSVRDLEPPAFVTPEEAAAWQAVCPDPGPLFGIRPAPEPAPFTRDALAAVQEHYYADPPRIERGWRQHLTDVHGRTYLDMVNNVAAIGHAHPRLTEAVSRQLALLNTNSRFNYRAIADFSRRLADLAPDPLDTVFLVNSGSEAVDLALRLVQVATGREEMLCVAEAYHGWTTASDAVSTSTADNPNAMATRPAWVRPVPAPHRDPDALAKALAMIGEPAGFIAEAFYGNAGGIPLPDGYLSAVYEKVRAHGGLCVADEVQVGYGRLGRHFWGFEQQGVVPDVITIAKAMGNGHPLGAVITTREIAETYRRVGYFFSSAGGSPVSCVTGLTVLDVIEEEGLQANAARVGDRLRDLIESLAAEHPIIGAVHGLGLYMGVELTRPDGSPATEETSAICDRMLELGVVVQPTGDHLNILKIKPPMVLTEDSAAFFAAALARTLSEGW